MTLSLRSTNHLTRATLTRSEKRAVRPTEVRVSGDGTEVEAIVLRYNVVDDYKTRFRPAVFRESLEEKMPVMVWGHDWREPVGRWEDYVDTNETLTLMGGLDDFDAVPRARQASAQLRSGTLSEFSVGFVRQADEPVNPDVVDGQRGVVDITKGQLDEVSLVLVGAVPGTKLLAVRSGLVVPEDAVIDLARRVQAGELTKDEAKIALELLADGEPPAASEEGVDNGGEVTDDGVMEQTAVDLAAALDRSRPR